MAYRFGPFVLNYETRQLLQNGRELHLSPKGFELLAILIRNRPRALSKGELQEALWPSTFVEETNIASLVAEVRRALGDPATTPAFLKTVHRFGYRFGAEVVDDAAPARPVSSGPRPFVVFANRKMMLLEGVNVIGRAPDAAILCDATGVSRHHARILVSAEAVTLEDLGSKNGTYLQHKRVTSAPLSDGDEIRVGNASLIFRVEPPLEPTETVAIDPQEV